jgi:adenine-specific DNA-methyltransferase
MSNNKQQKLELTWIGKGDEPILEPRILLENPEYSYGDTNTENMLIHGDNLLALKALEQDYAGKVKCIYIDPPYNTGNAFEHYDDNLEHSTWLSLIKPRIEILRNLLSADGSLWISIDDDECHYLKVLCDEVFGRQNFVSSIIWQQRTTRENRRAFSVNHEFILLYARDKVKFEHGRNDLGVTEELMSRYKNQIMILGENGNRYQLTLRLDMLRHLNFTL